MPRRLLLLAAAAAAAAVLTGCATGHTITIKVPVPTPVLSTPGGATPGQPSGGLQLPCNPQAASCWIPGAGETYMSYKPPRHYATAEALAQAAGCTVLSGPQSGGAPPAPAATPTLAECSLNGATMGSYLTEAMIFSSPLAEANWAGTMTRGAKTNDNAFYGLLGPGWAIGSITTVDDTRALQAQAATGGLVVCFPDSTDTGGDCTP